MQFIHQPSSVFPCFTSPFLDFSLKKQQENKMSSNSSVCQGLQSCLDPLSHEPRVLMHHLVPSKLDLSSPMPQTLNPIEKDYAKTDNSWNTIQSLNNTSFNVEKMNNKPEQKVYVHPLDKRSFHSLSARSLEMCTESLGCETGSGIDMNIDELSYYSLQKRISCVKKKAKTEKVKHVTNFPPPLTSISGNEGVKVQTLREGGRLVIKAFSCATRSSYFRVERKNGRLTLSLPNAERQEIEEEGEQRADEIDKSYYQEVEAKNGSLRNKESEEKNGRKFGGIIRCNGERSGSKRMPSLQYCVAIS